MNRSHALRIAELHMESHDVRRDSIHGGHDIAGWRVSQLMRDAKTVSQADEVDDKLNAWIVGRH